MSLLPLFTGVTRGMEFSEMCRCLPEPSLCYKVVRHDADRQRDKAGAHHDYRDGVVRGHPALLQLASSPPMLAPEVAPTCPPWAWLGSCARSSPCCRCFCAPWSPPRISSRSLPCFPRWC